MKNKIDIKQLKDGMIFSDTVYIDGDNVFVPANVPVKQKDLDRMISWGIPFVETDGSVLTEAAATASIPMNMDFPAVGSIENKKYLVYSEIISKVTDLFNKVAARQTVTNAEVDALINQLYTLVKEDSVQMLRFLILGRQKDDIMAGSAVNCVIICVLIGFQLKMPTHKLFFLATAALLHDIGMLAIPEQLRNKSNELDQKEVQLLRTHTLASYKTIVKELGYPEEIGNIAVQHHERWDGNGYPKRFKGPEIQLSARILSVADAFEAMMTRRSYRSSMIGYQAMKNLLSDNGRRFDPDILKLFIKSMGIYPLESLVILNDGSIGKVIMTNPSAPLRPKINILISKTGQQVNQESPMTVDLAEANNLFIIRAINPEELSAAPMI